MKMVSHVIKYVQDIQINVIVVIMHGYGVMYTPLQYLNSTVEAARKQN